MTSRCGYVYKDGTVCGMPESHVMHWGQGANHAFIPQQEAAPPMLVNGAPLSQPYAVPQVAPRCGYKYEDGTVCGNPNPYAGPHFYMSHPRYHAFIPQEAPQEAESEGELGLLPCPFCGGSPYRVHPLSGPNAICCNNSFCPAQVLEATPEEWNRRAPESVPTDESTERPWRMEHIAAGVTVREALAGNDEALAAFDRILKLLDDLQPVSGTPKAEEE